MSKAGALLSCQHGMSSYGIAHLIGLLPDWVLVSENVGKGQKWSYDSYACRLAAH